MMIEILRQLCFFSWKLKLMFLKVAFPRALVKTEAMVPLLYIYVNQLSKTRQKG